MKPAPAGATSSTTATSTTATSTSWHIELPHAPAAAPIARALVRNALGELESAVDRETAELLTCEVVTNAIEHTTGEAAVSLSVVSLPGSLLVEVSDRGPGPVRGLPRDGDGTRPAQYERGYADDSEAETVDELRESGRGLHLIRLLSADCGSRATRHGKTVWFRLRPGTGAAEDPAPGPPGPAAR